ncbi:MAG: M1 family peptidase, partial [Salegentibacter sp.]
MKYFQLVLCIFSGLSAFAQTKESINQTDKADFSRIQAEVSIYPEKQEVDGDVLYFFDVLQPADSIYIDAVNMQFTDVLLNGKKVKFSNNGKRLWLKKKFLPSEDNQLSLHYTVHPKKAMYFINWNAPAEVPAVKQVWTQGQGKYTSHWLPSFDNMAEKTEFDLGINFRNGYEVI